MKKVLVVMFSILLLGFVSVSQAADGQMPLMSDKDMQMMNCPAMKGMMMDGKMHPMMMQHGMMMQDMMRMMKDMMVIQKKMITVPKPEEAIKMQSDLDTMIAKMDKMMTLHQNCMMQMRQSTGNGKQIPSGQAPAPVPSEHKHQ